MKAQSGNITRDPVCGARVDAAAGTRTTSFNGGIYRFCSEDCRRAFERSPLKYLKAKGFIGRFLERLSRANQREFGRGGPCCH